jgi:hypothetical protein
VLVKSGAVHNVGGQSTVFSSVSITLPMAPCKKIIIDLFSTALEDTGTPKIVISIVNANNTDKVLFFIETPSCKILV